MKGYTVLVKKDPYLPEIALVIIENSMPEDK